MITNNLRLAEQLWDAVVIGAGPAGSTAARELARRGLRVMLVDQQQFPRAKVCGCCLSGAAVAALARLGLGHVLADAIPLVKTRIAASNRQAEVPLQGNMALSRESFDLQLIQEAVEAGVEFLPGTPAKLGEPYADHRRVVIGDHAIRARIVIVASGLAGKMADSEPGSRIGIGGTVPVHEVPSYYQTGTIYMATGKQGYVGLVRVESGALDVAAAVDPHFVREVGSPALSAARIVNEVGWPLPTCWREMSWKGTPALTRRPRTIAAHRLFVVGDAAGYVEPFTGEGMGWALMSAAALAPIAARAVNHWDDQLVSDWQQTHRRVLGQRQRLCRLMARVLRSPRFCRLMVRSLASFPILSRPVIAALNHPCHFPK